MELNKTFPRVWETKLGFYQYVKILITNLVFNLKHMLMKLSTILHNMSCYFLKIHLCNYGFERLELQNARMI